MGGDELRLVESHRDLGVLVDRSLKFHTHINEIVRKATGLSNQLLRCTVNRSEQFMVTLFVSHIRPLLDYCSSVWNLGYLADVHKLESVQRRWTKEVDGLEDIDYASRLRRLGMFSVRGRLIRADLIKIWKIFNADFDVGLSGIFERESHEATRGHQYKLSVPVCRTELRRRFFNVRSVTLWNGLPREIVGAGTVSQFKSLLDVNMARRFYEI